MLLGFELILILGSWSKLMEINKAIKSKKVYHICGSPTSDFFFELSMIYSRGVICPPGWKQSFIVIKPNNKWFCGENLDLLTSRAVSYTHQTLPTNREV